MFSKLFRQKTQRQHKRFRASFLVKYRVKGKEEPRITNVLDISAGGLRFWTTEELHESASLNLSIYIPPIERSVDAEARILRVRKSKDGGLLYYVAVSFTDLKEEDRSLINEFAEGLSKDDGAKFTVDHAEVVVRKS